MRKALVAGLALIPLIFGTGPAVHDAAASPTVLTMGFSMTLDHPLCDFPLVPSNGACVPPPFPIQTPVGKWFFSVPSPLPIVGSFCVATGPSGIDDACEIDSSGLVTPSVVGPWCDLVSGAGGGTLMINGDPSGLELEWQIAGREIEARGKVDGQLMEGVGQTLRFRPGECVTTPETSLAAVLTLVAVP